MYYGYPILLDCLLLRIINVHHLSSRLVVPVLSLAPAPIREQGHPNSTHRVMSTCRSSDDPTGAISTPHEITPNNPADRLMQTSGGTTTPLPISINKFNFLNPPLPFVTALHRRSIKKLGITDLIEYLKRPLLGPCGMECVVSIFMKPTDIDPTCINLEVRLGRNAPELKFSDTGKRNANIIIQGDPECFAALTSIASIFNGRYKEKSKRKEKVLKELRLLKLELLDIGRDLEEAKGGIQCFSICGATVYDAGSYHSHLYLFHSS